MDLNIAGKRALVTGATAGLGKHIALSLAREGVDLALVGRRLGLLEQVANEAKGLGSSRVSLIALDMMQAEAINAAAAQAEAELGGIDILVNCMGASGPVEWDAPDEVWDANLTLNWTRHRQLTNRLLPAMREQSWGRIVNVSGLGESERRVNTAIVAKAAVHAWSKSLADVIAPDAVKINCVAPGRINSEQIERFLPDPEIKAAYAKASIPMRRLGEPEKFADLVAFLCSQYASSITGTVIPVDGGFRQFLF
jgi:3-oxoacyl-[acyl-carrier protein] reductase